MFIAVTSAGTALVVWPETVSNFCGMKVTVKREVIEVTSQKLEHF